MKKKFLAVILTAVLSVSMIPAVGVAAEEKTAVEAPDQISVSTPTPSVTEPTVTPVPEDTEDPISTPAPTQVPKKINVKWTAFRWTSHTSAAVTLRANVNGKCYYGWSERKSNGTSNVQYISAKSPNVLIKADQNFVIYLNDLNTDEAVDLYIRIEDENGRTDGIKKVKLNQDIRPAAIPAHTPVIPSVNDSVLRGLDTRMEFYPNKFYPFSVIGAGTTNENPGEGDVKWEPLYWSTSVNPRDSEKHSTWKIGSAKGITEAKMFNMYVFFQKWVYTGNKWTETDTISSARYEFGSANLLLTPTPKPTSKPIKLSTPSLSGASNSSYGIIVKWKSVKNASGYKIYRKTGTKGKWKNIAKVTGNRTLIYTDGSVKHGTTYTYTVRAYKNSSVSAYNKKGSKIICLKAPVQYAPSSKKTGKMTVKWKKSASVSGYQIQYSVSQKFTGSKTVSTSATTKTLSGLKKGKTYYTRIRTFKKTGGKTYYSAWGSAKKAKVRK